MLMEMGDGDTLSERAAALVQRDILAGTLRPRAKLAVQDLARRYGIGATPIREALSRLVSQGLIVATGRRGFSVADIGFNDLTDITGLRVLIEREALHRSMRQGDAAWEAGVLAALHLLRRDVEQRGEVLGEGAQQFDTLHKAFHTAILSACASPRMMEAASVLYDQAYRYRRVMMRKMTDPAVFIAGHAQLADSVLERRAPEALEMLEAHLRSSVAMVYPDGDDR